MLQDRCPGRWGRQGQDGCSDDAGIPGGRPGVCLGRRAPFLLARLLKPPPPARARAHPPAGTHRRPRPPAPGPHSMAPGRPPLRPSVCPSGPRPSLLSRHHRRSAAGGSESPSNSAPEVMRGECASEEPPAVSGRRGKATAKRIGWIIVGGALLGAGPRAGGAECAGGET